MSFGLHDTSLTGIYTMIKMVKKCEMYNKFTYKIN